MPPPPPSPAALSEGGGFLLNGHQVVPKAIGSPALAGGGHWRVGGPASRFPFPGFICLLWTRRAGATPSPAFRRGSTAPGLGEA